MLIDSFVQAVGGSMWLISLTLAAVGILFVVRKEQRQESANKATGLTGRAARRAYRFSRIDDDVREFHRQGAICAKVKRVYQRSKRGSKAVIVLPNGERVDAWFWWFTPKPGSIVFIAPSVG